MLYLNVILIKNREGKMYLELYWSFFKIGLFSIGGGYASLPLIQKEIVELHKWLTMEQFTDILTISQMTPGPIAINSSTFVGIQVGGYFGAVVATLGCVTPSFIIVLTLAYFYFKYKNLNIVNGILYGLRPAVVALIGAAGLSIVLLAIIGDKKINLNNIEINYISLIFTVVGLYSLKKYKTNPTHVMLLCGLAGAIIYNFQYFLGGFLTFLGVIFSYIG